MTAENCLSAIGAYTSVDEALVAARVLIREIPDDYVNCQYLKDYFTKVAAYAEYFENVSGSYNDLQKLSLSTKTGFGLPKSRCFLISDNI